MIMHDVELIVKLVLFMISTFGYFCFFYRRSFFHVTIIPLFVGALQVTVLFVLSLIGLLFPCALILYLGGFVLLFLEWKSYKTAIVQRCIHDHRFWFALIMFCILALLLWKKEFSRLDDFTHWALIEKIMLSKDRLPNTTDRLMHHAAYPPGSALYIYYFVRMIGEEEFLQMLGQAYLIICGLLPLWAFTRKKSSIILMFLVSLYIMTCNVSFYGLKVDTLLPVCGVCLFIVYYLEFHGKENILPQKILMCIPLIFFTMLVKNPGILFVLTFILLILPQLMKKGKIRWIVALLTTMILSYGLWRVYYHFAYPAAETSSHAMTVQNYVSVISEKAGMDISLLFFNIVRNAFLNNENVLLLGWIIIPFLPYVFADKRMRGEWIAYVFKLAILYGVYVVGVYLMYLFSMSAVETEVLAGFDRYMGTIRQVCWLAGTAFVLAKDTEMTKGNHLCFAAAVAIVVLSLVLLPLNEKLLNGPVCEDAFDNLEEERVFIYPEISSPNLRKTLDDSISDYRVKPGKKYLFCFKPDTSYVTVHYFWYMAEYCLYSSNIDIASWENGVDDEWFYKYDYVIIKDMEEEEKEKYLCSFDNVVFMN